MNKKLLPFALLLAWQMGMCQAKLRKMTTVINHPAINNYAPYISFDGNSIVYLADVGEDNAITMSYSTRMSTNWTEPVVLPKWINNRLNFMKGYALSEDGKTLYITNARSNGMGGFDIYTSQLIGNAWAEPMNMLLPVNSKVNDGCPSISLDGSMMFYMRCDKMDFSKAEGCRILWIRKKPNGQWGEPVELPAYINSGNSQTPRILGDGESLLFSSNKLLPNKGGMDLYMTKMVDGQWSQPQSLDFANTAADDQYVTATSMGMYLVKDAPSQHSSELVELLFPPEVRPGSMVKITGTVAGPDELSSAFVTVFNMKDQTRFFSTRPGKDGVFIAYAKQGGLYELSIDPEKDNYTFYSKVFDLRGEALPSAEKLEVRLTPASPGGEVILEGVSFKPNSSQMTETSSQELRRVSRLMLGNPDKSFAIEVTLLGYQKDSLRSNPDLTEIITDTIRIPVVYKKDSISMATRDSLVVHTTYHNDRTLQEAKVIGNTLIMQGIPPGRIACSGKAEVEAILENRKTVVKIIIH